MSKGRTPVYSESEINEIMEVFDNGTPSDKKALAKRMNKHYSTLNSKYKWERDKRNGKKRVRNTSNSSKSTKKPPVLVTHIDKLVNSTPNAVIVLGDNIKIEMNKSFSINGLQIDC